METIKKNVSMNRVNLIGKADASPRMKYECGELVAHWSLATETTYTDTEGQQVKETQWHNLTARGEVAKQASKLVSRGQQIAVEGAIITGTTEGDGVRRYFTEIKVSEFLIFGHEEKKTP